METKNEVLQYEWVKWQSYHNHSTAKKVSIRYELLVNRKTKIQKEGNLYWIYTSIGAPIIKNINHVLEEN